MSGDTVLIKSLDFTNSVGNRGARDETFTDVIDYGGFPFEQKIDKITHIDVFADTSDPQTAVITGIKVTYKYKDEGGTETVTHGIVVGVETIGQCILSDTEILVGVYGQLKDPNVDSENGGRLVTITFLVFNEAKTKADIVKGGPYEASSIGHGEVFANFGHIIAFQGTKADGVGLTSLGFIETAATS